ncbi:DgyrCDS7576 [Dimorphilus gyrociliatus]|uniref:Poly [ADP-ribose] polymerase n=1 Tax=Dimorphilus gyrociliatus TaxID=2664684 RepID=A0A7I8VWD7_9ANNE|nr:DgyrCDS7576 [Dimorphilus gyrociliatus]
MGDSEYPFKAEYAKSNRASCKKCFKNIGKDSLRLAIMVQSPHFDGKTPNWYHYNCFWERVRGLLSVNQIHNFDALRWDDQKKIKDKVSGSADGEDGAYSGETNYKDFLIDYAKSGASVCRGCDSKIPKQEVRLAKKDFESQRARMYGPQNMWYHQDCFVENRDDLGFSTEMQPDQIPGYKQLAKEDKETLIEKLGKGVKRKATGGTEATKPKKVKKEKEKEEKPEEKKLREQSEMLWAIRDKLSNEVSNNALKGLLEYNNQDVPSGNDNLLDRVTDCMAFGLLKKCPECKEGQLVHSKYGYSCRGNISAWTKCQYRTSEPERDKFEIPEDYHDVEYFTGKSCYRCTGNFSGFTACSYTTVTPERKPFKIPEEYLDADCLAKYKYKKRTRVFPPAPKTAVNAGTDANVELPLKGMTFVIGKTTKSKAELTKEIKDLGGTVATAVDEKTFAVFSNEAEVKKNLKVIKEAKKNNIQVVKEDFLEEAMKVDPVSLIDKHKLCDWGDDPKQRIQKPKIRKSIMEKQREKDEKMFSGAEKTKMKVKGGAAVDPDSGLEDTAHLLQDKGEPYNVVLNMVDIQKGTNSYYKLQILESDKGKLFWVFRAWGRVGTTIGGNKLDEFRSKDRAIDNFTTVYYEKTGNEWSERKDFQKKPRKFYPIEIDYGAEDEDIEVDLSGKSNSKLAKEIQDIIRLIFDVESMKKAMLEFEIDLKKMPLGKLSKKQIEDAYKVLNELQHLIDTGGSPTQYLDASNRFYTLIPHDFGLRKPTVLNTVDIIKSKNDMLTNLLDIEVAYSLLKGGKGSESDPIDVHYQSLKTDMEVLNKESLEFKQIVDYVRNTHAATHNQYQLEVIDVLKIDKHGEDKRYKPFKDLHNRQLLWHGSRTTNFAGILSQGLRIAPPEAPVTGYMFGKGIYFADMVSKSANYCRTSKAEPTGLLLLCEVALGNMYECKAAEYVTNLPKGKHSTKGKGMTVPNPEDKIITGDGVEIPLGKGTNSKGERTSLLYNEYIVYDVSQVRMKYLIKMDFKFKW